MTGDRFWRLCLIAASLLIAGLACGTGTSTTSTHLGNRGTVVVNIKEADGSSQTEVEINDDFSWESLALELKLEVGAGSYRATFRDSDGETVTLEASAGAPDSARARLSTDAFGNIDLSSEASGAQQVKITIDYTR